MLFGFLLAKIWQHSFSDTLVFTFAWELQLLPLNENEGLAENIQHFLKIAMLFFITIWLNVTLRCGRVIKETVGAISRNTKICGKLSFFYCGWKAIQTHSLNRKTHAPTKAKCSGAFTKCFENHIFAKALFYFLLFLF